MSSQTFFVLKATIFFIVYFRLKNKNLIYLKKIIKKIFIKISKKLLKNHNFN